MEEILIHKFGFSESDVQITQSLFNRAFFKAKSLFVEEGSVSKHLGIVLSGLFRTFYMNQEGNDITTAFHEPGTLLLSIESFNKQVHSKENIIALEDSEVLRITQSDWVRLNGQVPKWRNVCQTTGDAIGMMLQSRLREFQTKNAQDRYAAFCKKHPLVCRKAAVGHIASYLGIDIATLSRIRKRVQAK